MVTLFILPFLVFNILAQRKPVRCDKLAKLRFAADSLLSKGPYRVIRTYETLKGPSEMPVNVSKSILEIVPPDSVHIYMGLESTNQKDRSETITVGSAVFSKTSDADWIKLPPAKDYPSPPDPVPDAKVCWSFPIEKIAGTDVIRFEMKSTFKDTDLSNGKMIISIYLSTYWFSRDGHFVKNAEEEPKRNYRYTGIYEYDPEIKIEAPIKKR